MVPPGSHQGAGAHEPAGMTPIGYTRFDQLGTFRKVDIYGRHIYDHPSGSVIQSGGGSASIVSDGSAGQVLDMLWKKGCMGLSGHSCGNNINMNHANRKVAEQYIAFEMYVDANYWLNPSGNKSFGPTVPGGNIYHVRHYPLTGADWGSNGADPYMQVGFGPKLCGVDRNIYGNKSPSFSRSDWHLVEVYTKMASGPCTGDGIITIWLDGVQVVHETDVNTYDPAGGIPTPGSLTIEGASAHPIFGGGCTSSTAPCPDKDTHLRFKSVYISGK